MFDPAYMIEITEGKIGPADLAALDALFDAAAKQDGPVVLHFHGGLVSKSVATKAGAEDSPFYRQSGAFPIYPIWKTGPGEVLPEVLGEIAKEALFKLVLDRVLGMAHAHVKNALGMRGATVQRTLPTVDEVQMARSVASDEGDFQADFINPADFEALKDRPDLDITPMEERSMQRQIERDTELLAEIDAILNGANLSVDDNTRSASSLAIKSPPKSSHADREFLEDFRQEANTRGFGLKAGIAILKIIGRFIKRYIQGKDHGVHATAVEEVLREVYGSYVGTIGWSVMKGYTETAGGSGGASLEVLERIKNKLAGKRVMLVGHSAGAIFVCNLIKAAAQNGYDHPFEVIFLAPAVRMKTFKEGILDHKELLAKKPDGSYCFRTFTMSDAMETKDTLIRNIPHLGDLTWLYPRSLLYLISGILEGKEEDADVLGLQRFHSPTVWNAGDPNVAASRNFMLIPGHTCYAITVDGTDAKMATNSTMHGGFGAFTTGQDGKPTNSSMTSIANILQTGW